MTDEQQRTSENWIRTYGPVQFDRPEEAVTMARYIVRLHRGETRTEADVQAVRDAGKVLVISPRMILAEMSDERAERLRVHLGERYLVIEDVAFNLIGPVKA